MAPAPPGGGDLSWSVLCLAAVYEIQFRLSLGSIPETGRARLFADIVAAAGNEGMSALVADRRLRPVPR